MKTRGRVGRCANVGPHLKVRVVLPILYWTGGQPVKGREQLMECTGEADS